MKTGSTTLTSQVITEPSIHVAVGNCPHAREKPPVYPERPQKHAAVPGEPTRRVAVTTAQ